jgi:hypothetical protein
MDESLYVKLSAMLHDADEALSKVAPSKRTPAENELQNLADKIHQLLEEKVNG